MNMQSKPVEQSTQKSHRLYMAFIHLAAALMPSILLFNLYNRNRAENVISFTHVLALAGGLAIIALLLFWLLRIATRSIECAIFVSILFWLAFWMFEAMLGLARNYTATLSPNTFLVTVVLALIFTA